MQRMDLTRELARAQYMARHYRSKHSKEKPFQCEFCDHAFSRRCVRPCSVMQSLEADGFRAAQRLAPPTLQDVCRGESTTRRDECRRLASYQAQLGCIQLDREYWSACSA